jgi:GNAT superfamily N-acetyltransferase
MVALDRQIFADCDPPPWESVTWWVVCDGRNVVGYAGASLMDRGKTLQLVRVGLAPEARGKGLQRRLIAARQRWGRRARGPEVHRLHGHLEHRQLQQPHSHGL